MKPAVLYAAKSTADLNASIPGQFKDGVALAEADGWTVVDQFEDENKSAFTGNRGDGLADAMQLAESLAQEHGECALMVQHSDRLARGDGIQAAHLVEYMLWALKAGVKIMSKQDPQTFVDLLYTVVTGQRNHEDSARKSESVRDGIDRRVRERELPTGGGTRRYGYQWSESRKKPPLLIPFEGSVIDHRMYQAILEGAPTLQIARELMADGVKTVRAANGTAPASARSCATLSTKA